MYYNDPIIHTVMLSLYQIKLCNSWLSAWNIKYDENV
jgi:hypothetical protein